MKGYQRITKKTKAHKDRLIRFGYGFLGEQDNHYIWEISQFIETPFIATNESIKKIIEAKAAITYQVRVKVSSEVLFGIPLCGKLKKASCIMMKKSLPVKKARKELEFADIDDIISEEEEFVEID